MAAPRRTGRSRFGLFVLLLTSVTLLTLDARNFGPVETLKDGVAAVVSPFRSLGDTVFSPIGDAWTSISENDELEAELERLREEVELLNAGRIADTGAAEELEALKVELGLPIREEYDTVIAEVVAGSISNFDEFVVEINQGSLDGVRDGMPVVTEGGLVGRVEDTGAQNARVRLISDPTVSVPVQVLGTETVGLMTGRGSNQPLRVGNGSVRIDEAAEVGDFVVTSGSSRSLYPFGVAVGVITEVEIDQGTLEKRLLIEPSASTTRLRFVTVLLYDPEAIVEPEPTPEADATGSPRSRARGRADDRRRGQDRRRAHRHAGRPGRALQ